MPGAFSWWDTPLGKWEDRTEFEVEVEWPGAIYSDWVESPSLVEGVQELVDEYGGINEVVLLEGGVEATAWKYGAWASYDRSPSLAARLYVTYAVPTTPTPTVTPTPVPTPTPTLTPTPAPMLAW